MILVTGSTGGLGKETISALQKIVPAQQIAALARHPEKAADLSAAGISVRKGDYSDYNSLLSAFAGIEKLVIISVPAFSDPALDANTIRAAQDAGVKYVLYTGIQQKQNSGWIIPGVTERDLEVEKLLRASKMSYTIAHNALYMDSLPFLLGSGVIDKGVRFPSGNGKAAVASRSDLGEALARMIAGDTIFPEHITLSNYEHWSRFDFAAILSDVTGKKVVTVDASPEEYIAYQEACGIPPFAAKFAAEWAATMKVGELEDKDPFLENILGRKPVSLKTFLSNLYQSNEQLIQVS